MKKVNVKKLALGGMLSAVILVMTVGLHLPVPATGGYVHLGDGFIFLTAAVLGPYAALAAGIGSALADLLGGYFIYIPATFLIKAIVALAAYLLNKKIKNILVCALIAEIFMILGYYIYSVILTGSIIASLSGIPTNAVQGVVGAILGCILVKPIRNNKYFNRLWE